MPPQFTNIVNMFQRAAALQQAGRFDEALTAYRQLLVAIPDAWEIWHNMGLIHCHRGQLNESIECHKRAIAIRPDVPEFYNEIGESLRFQGLAYDALEYYDKAISLDPDFLPAHNNRSMVLSLMGRITDALASARKVTDALTSGLPHPYFEKPAIVGRVARPHLLAAAANNVGNYVLEFADHQQAARYHRIAFDSEPHPVAYSNWLRDQVFTLQPAPAELLPAIQDWWKRCTSGIKPIAHPRACDPGKRLRVGFMSADFRVHSVAWFLSGLFENVDRSQFEFFCYSQVPNPDDVTRRFQSLASQWRSIVGYPDEQVASIIKNDSIDILLDLGGHTADSRLRVFAYKPAPVQIAYLGSPITAGTPLIPWRITDSIADPPGMTDSHFVEKLYRLDRCAWCYQSPKLQLPERSRKGTPFTFGSLNAFTKVTPQILDLWSKILVAVPNSRLLIKALALGDEPFRRLVTQKFADRGVASGRLVLLPRAVRQEDHLATYHQVDLSLDTFPYNGTTTTCESLYMNVPVLTLTGQTHHSRVSASLLTAAGLCEFITYSPEEYVAAAVRLANSPDELALLHRTLRARLQSSPLCDAASFTRTFTTALREIYKICC